MPSFLQSAPDETQSEGAETTQNEDTPLEPTSAQEDADDAEPVEVAQEAEGASEDATAPVHAAMAIDVPDPDDTQFTAAPSALSAALSITSLSADQREALLPLVARLAAHRDQLNAGGAQTGLI